MNLIISFDLSIANVFVKITENPKGTLPLSAFAHSTMEKSRRGIQSIEIGSELLLQLARHVRPVPLKDLAKAAGMTTGKAHPYMVSFLKVGFVTQTSGGHYELGPLALQLGLTRLQRMDPVKEASPLLEPLAHATGQSVALVVWGNLGPTIVRLEEPIQPLHVNLRTGTVMSLSTTATGRLFAAYMPPKMIERLMTEELTRQSYGTAEPLSHDLLEQRLAEIRKHGLSRTKGNPIPGIDAFCAPVFDSMGHLVLGILIMGPTATFDSDWEGKIATPLRQCALDVSRRLGRDQMAS